MTPGYILTVRKLFPSKNTILRTTPKNKPATHLPHRFVRLGMMVVFVALAATAFFYTGSSASSFYRSSRVSRPTPHSDAASTLIAKADESRPGKETKTDDIFGQNVAFGSKAAGMFPALMLQSGTTIQTYADSAHNNPSDSFNLTQTAYVKVSVPGGILARRRIVWVDPEGYIRRTTDVTTSAAEDEFTLPSTSTSNLGSITVSNLGRWRVNVISNRSALIATHTFTVGDPNTAIADLSIQVASASDIPANSDDLFNIHITNYGPATAQSVTTTYTLPANTSFVSATPANACNQVGSTVTCTAPSLAKGEEAFFTITYHVAGGTSAGTVISNTATVSSATTELNPGDNSGTAKATVVGGTAETCSLNCPDDITVVANASDNGQSGAYVNYGSVQVAGDCGAINMSKASGTFFPLGSTTVIATSATNGGSCSFTVTVVETAQLTITCPSDKDVPAAQNECSATVDPGTPTTNPANVPVEGVRSDNQPLNAPYPGGVTTITWTATDSSNRTASCVQKITVTVNDTTLPTITAPDDVTYACANEVPEAQGSDATASDNCGTPSVGVTASNNGGAGTPSSPLVITRTYTATDGAGNTASDSQTITVIDSVPPTLTVPDSITVSASASCEATIPDVVAQSSATDNCGGAVTLTQSPAAGTTVGLGPHTITVTATDAAGNSTSAPVSFTVKDTTPPSIAAPSAVTVIADAGSCSATNVSLGAPTTGDNCSVASVSNNAPASFPVGQTTVIWTVLDGSGNSSTAPQIVTVTNPNPVVTLTGPASGAVYAVNTPVNFTGTYTDAGGGTHAAVWAFDSETQAATVTEPSGSTPGTANLTHSFTTAGVYFVKLTVTDSCGGTGTATQISELDAMVVIYDPSAGFVTGGGWINSPLGAYAPNPSLTGKANFGFVSKYKNGASTPTGQTEFQFKAGNLNFQSKTYDWLVIAGAKAQYKGTGTINGSGSYGFMLTATDGQINGGGGTDKFRMKIWDKNNGDAIVYDNQMGGGIDDNPTTVLGGGSIIIHK